MNPGVGAPELLIIIILALVVVGPRDLPLMMRRVGRFVGQARSMARDFQRSFDELGREAEMEELRKEIEALKNANPLNEVSRELRGAENELRALASERPHPRLGGGSAKSDAEIIAAKNRAAREAEMRARDTHSQRQPLDAAPEPASPEPISAEAAPPREGKED